MSECLTTFDPGIRDLLIAACDQAGLIDDQQLAADLKTLISRVKRRQAGGTNR